MKELLIVILISLIIYFFISTNTKKNKIYKRKIEKYQPKNIIKKTLIKNDTVDYINNLTTNILLDVNKFIPKIYFNSSIKQLEHIKPNDIESKEYGLFLTEKLNEYSKYNYYTFVKIINISKEQIENQIKINFNLYINYNSKETKDIIPLKFNVILFIEELYDDIDIFKNNGEKDIRTYIHKFEYIPKNLFK